MTTSPASVAAIQIDDDFETHIKKRQPTQKKDLTHTSYDIVFPGLSPYPTKADVSVLLMRSHDHAALNGSFFAMTFDRFDRAHLRNLLGSDPYAHWNVTTARRRLKPATKFVIGKDAAPSIWKRFGHPMHAGSWLYGRLCSRTIASVCLSDAKGPLAILIPI